MKTIKFIGKVYDMKAMEYVSHITEIQISDELSDMLAKEISEGIRKAKFEDGQTLVHETPLKNTKRYRFANEFEIGNEDGTTQCYFRGM